MKRKLLTVLFAALLLLSLAVSVSAASDADLYDDAELLDSAQEARVEEALSRVGGQFDAQIVIVTVASSEESVDALVEECYDSNNMGLGENRDGVLLLVCMDPREYRILSNGFAGDAIGQDEIDAIGDAIVSDLSDGDYESAFTAFAEQCAYYLDGYLNGFPFPAGKNLATALIIGAVVGLIVALVLKGQLKSVRKQNQANTYIKTGSMRVTTETDLFLYREVSRTKKESSGSSGSSGSSRNVGGGSF